MASKRGPLVSDEQIRELILHHGLWSHDNSVVIDGMVLLVRDAESLVRQRIAERCVAPSGTRYCGCACHGEGRDE